MKCISTSNSALLLVILISSFTTNMQQQFGLKMFYAKLLLTVRSCYPPALLFSLWIQYHSWRGYPNCCITDWLCDHHGRTCRNQGVNLLRKYVFKQNQKRRTLQCDGVDKGWQNCQMTLFTCPCYCQIIWLI